jgi:hypothetical protein
LVIVLLYIIRSIVFFLIIRKLVKISTGDAKAFLCSTRNIVVAHSLVFCTGFVATGILLYISMDPSILMFCIYLYTITVALLWILTLCLFKSDFREKSAERLQEMGLHCCVVLQDRQQQVVGFLFRTWTSTIIIPIDTPPVVDDTSMDISETEDIQETEDNDN